MDKSPRNSQYVVLNVFEHLVELDTDGQLLPGLGTSWQLLNDRTLEGKLRQWVKFHNSEVFDREYGTAYSRPSLFPLLV
ncbi:MAG: hypothetical protein HYZ81_25520 [Nitrospinae bacterium]|nr:hypothetical protein [Nitrospinota bacterium]